MEKTGEKRVMVQRKTGPDTSEERERMILENLYLVRRVASRFTKFNESMNGCSKEGLTSAGTSGLIEAVDSFDPSQSNHIVGYATPMIVSEIKHFLRDKEWPVEISGQLQKPNKQLATDYEKETNAPFNDSLTGLFNHGFFQISLEREIKRSQRYGTTFTVGLIDIDSFSFYNNLHGALEGDGKLKEIAGVIEANVRQTDLVARLSGDVFAVIFTKSDTGTAVVKTAERIRYAVEQLADAVLTVSIGLASFPKDATNRESLINKAQEALMQAKIRGKNRVYFFEEEKRPLDESRPRILVVDDEPLNLKILEAILIPLNYEVVKAINGEEALYILKKMEIDLVLLDIMMPGMDGYEVCRRLKGSEATRLIPVVMVTALDDMEAKIKGIEAGADNFITKPPNRMELLARTRSLIDVKKLTNSLTSMENVFFSLANTVEAKDPYTHGHTERVSNMAMTLGRKMGLSPKEIEAVRFGGALHDIGKIGVPGNILTKPSPLDPEEWDIIKTHPEIGYKICLPLKKNLGSALKVIRHHHEKLNGSGYPDGLKGDEISMLSRIMAVADTYDALLSDRSYRRRMPEEKVLGILHQEALEGKLDKEVVEKLDEWVG